MVKILLAKWQNNVSKRKIVTWSSSPRSCQVCHSRGLDTTDVDPEALVRWLADWVELSDAAGGKKCCCEKWRRFQDTHNAILGRQLCSVTCVLFSMFTWFCTCHPPDYMFSHACNWLHVTWGIGLTAFVAVITNNSLTPHSYFGDWFRFFSQIPMNHFWLIVLSLRPWIIAETKIYLFKEDDTEEINIIVGCC